MIYTPTQWIDGQTRLSAEHFNNIESAICELVSIVNQQSEQITELQKANEDLKASIKESFAKHVAAAHSRSKK